MTQTLVRVARPPHFLDFGAQKFTTEMRVLALMALCNISANPKYQENIIRQNTVEVFELALDTDNRDVVFQVTSQLLA
jgi:hypothetical protein